MHGGTTVGKAGLSMGGLQGFLPRGKRGLFIFAFSFGETTAGKAGLSMDGLQGFLPRGWALEFDLLSLFRWNHRG